MLNLAVAQRAQYFDINGEFPLSGGRVTYYDVGTTTPKPIYADPYGNIQLPNPLVLDIGGFVPVSGVFYGEGNYTILVESLVNPGSPTPVWAEEYTIPDVPGSIISSITGTNVIFITSVEEIQNLTPNQYDFVYCQQYYNSQTQDQGGGWFRWYPNATAPTNLGTVIATLGSPSLGRYIREFTSNEVSTAMFGVVSNTNTNMVARIQEAAVWANANKMTLVLSPGDIQCQGDFAIDAPAVRIEAGFKLIRLVSLSPTNMTINASEIDVQGLYPLCTANTNIYFNSKTPFDIYPQWFGSVGDGYTDDYSALKNATESQILSPNARIVITNPMRISATGNPGTPEITLSNVLFYKNSYIENWLTQSAIKLTGTVELEDGAEWVLRAVNYELDRYAVIGQVAHAHWFFNSTPNVDEFVNTCTAITNIGTTTATLIWDFPVTYDIPDILFNTTCKLVTHQVGPLTKWNVLGTFSAANGIYPVSWFANGLEDAVTLASFNQAWVDGEFKEYSNVSVSFSGLNVYIRNITITGYTGYVMTLANSIIRFKNVEIGGDISESFCNWEMYDTRLFGTTSQTLTFSGPTINIKRSEIGGYVKVIFGSQGLTNTIILQDNTFDGSLYEFNPGQQKNMVTTNLFKNLNTTTSSVPLVKVFDGSNMSIVGNTFEVFPGLVLTTGTGFNVLFFQGSGGVVNNLLVDANSFWHNSDMSVGYRMTPIDCTGYANYGHNARVRNNVHYDKNSIANANWYIRETERTVGPQLLIKQPGDMVTNILSDVRLIFPFLQYPVMTATTYVVENTTYIPTFAPYQITIFPSTTSGSGGRYDISELDFQCDNNKDNRWVSIYINCEKPAQG